MIIDIFRPFWIVKGRRYCITVKSLNEVKIIGKILWLAKSKSYQINRSLLDFSILYQIKEGNLHWIHRKWNDALKSYQINSSQLTQISFGVEFSVSLVCLWWTFRCWFWIRLEVSSSITTRLWCMQFKIFVLNIDGIIRCHAAFAKARRH